MLVADRVSFTYGQARVVDDVSVTVERGAVVGILGPNGAGKTTLLALLAGTRTPSSGVVRLDDVPLAALGRRDAARRLAIVPQETHPTFAYTALEIALMGRYPWLGAFELEGPADLAIAREALETTGTAHFSARAFSSLSGGERQRVVIASALAQVDQGRDNAQAPAVLLLDEPTTALDLRYQLEVTALIGRLRRERGVTIVLSTHDLRLAAAACTHVVLLDNGRVMGQGPTAQMLTAERVGALYGIDRPLVEAFLR